MTNQSILFHFTIILSIFDILISVNLTVTITTQKQLFRTNNNQIFQEIRNHWAMFQRSPPQPKMIKTNSPAFHHVEFLKCLWSEIFYQLLWKSFQNDEEWHLFYCNSTLGGWVIQDFDLCKLDDLWCHFVDTKWCKITKITTFSV